MNESETLNIDRLLQLLNEEVKVVNIGLELFAETFARLGVEAVHVDWRPPAEGDPDLSDMLAALQGRS